MHKHILHISQTVEDDRETHSAPKTKAIVCDTLPDNRFKKELQIKYKTTPCIPNTNDGSISENKQKLAYVGASTQLIEDPQK